MEISKRMNDFYNDKVILPSEKVSDLRKKKRINIDRLKSGINLYNDEKNTNYKLYESLEQGSIAMATAIDPEYDDFDIDVAIVFEKDKIPSDTETVKNLIIDFLKPYTSNFKKNPTKKKNCIRIDYADNYHIDFAIYRIDNNSFYEHCGINWTDRNPRSINNWFYDSNIENNGNLRIITRLIKYFSKSRNEWDICGGLLITILVSEQLNENNKSLGLDKLLLEVINNIITRLKGNLDIYNPVNNQLITNDDKSRDKVAELLSKLEMFVCDLNDAYQNDDSTKISNAWNKFFKIDFFDIDDNSVESKNRTDDNEMFIENLYPTNRVLPIQCEIICKRYIIHNAELNKNQIINCINGVPFKLIENKSQKLCFSVKTNVSQPYSILWKIRNNGNIAIHRNMLRGEICCGNTFAGSESRNSLCRYESIDFIGNHYVECYLIKDNEVLASDKYDVIIK